MNTHLNTPTSSSPLNYVVVTGDLSSGYSVYGPFESDHAAYAVAFKNLVDQDFWTVPLHMEEGISQVGVEGEKRCVAAVGDFQNGFTFYGPFQSELRLRNWAEDRIADLIHDCDDERAVADDVEADFKYIVVTLKEPSQM
jgi:hypothetical protein